MKKTNKLKRSPEAHSAHPVSKHFEESGNNEISELLLANSADSLRTALDYYQTPLPHNSNYKYSILLLDHSFETLFKSRISQESKEAIIKSKNEENFKTLGFDDCFNELEKKGVILSDQFKGALVDLHSIRNDIWHFGFLGNKENLDRLISFCSCVYWVFTMKYMPKYGIRPILKSKQFDLLMSFENSWHFANYSAAQIMVEWHENLDPDQDQYIPDVCEECLTPSFITDKYNGTSKCKCCGYEPIRDK